MRRSLIAFVLLVTVKFSAAQELFVYSEPASNMPVNSFAVRANNYLSQNAAGNYSYSLAPEIMVGLSKKLMFHAETFFGNRINDFRFDGASLYAKYRFFTEEDVHSHFRMAVAGKAAVSEIPVMQDAIDLAGKNSGAELGLVATKLLNKSAYSAGISFVSASDNTGKNRFYGPDAEKKAVNYNLSFGHLFLPAEYKDYEQVNLNGMIELLGQMNTGTGRSYLDLAPSAQLIFSSKMRVDLGYRFPIVTSLYRMQERGFLLRLEYNFFSVFK